MITPELALSLRRAGMHWRPANGDRFLVPNRDLDDQLFTVSDMVVEVERLPTGMVMRFNGTVEWALDSIEQREVLWLPREDQLRSALGLAFRRLEADGADGGFAVVVTGAGGGEQRHEDADVECAYARALLAVLGHPAGA